jgi:effector-binding domain-containing protein
MVVLNEVSILEICQRVKQLGYCTGNHIRMYGERFEVLSDPFPNGNGIAIKARAKGDETVRVVNLPATVLQSVKQKRASTSA